MRLYTRMPDPMLYAQSHLLRHPVNYHTTSNAFPPASASNCTTCWRPILMLDDSILNFRITCHIPMTSKNAFGSIPWADMKSVPVFFSDFIAARMQCTAATQDTREKTASI